MTAKLSQIELERIFERRIRPGFDTHLSKLSSFNPVLIMVGAQPGAGKSRSMTRVLSEYPGASQLLVTIFDDTTPPITV